MRAYTVDEKSDEKRCDKFILEKLPGFSAAVFKAFRKRNVKVNGKRVKEDYALAAGDLVEVFIPDAYLEASSTEPEEPDVPIVYEDDHILVVSKPQGLAVHKDDNSEAFVLDALMQKKLHGTSGTGFPALCHRIDRNTGGLVLLAKDAETLECLTEKFRSHEIRKFYLTVVNGIPEKKNDRMTAWLEKDGGKSRVYIHDRPMRGADKIITGYRILTANYPYALLEVEIVTGKTHQIRAHMAYIGHPVLGDGKYGINPRNRSLKLNYQALFSWRLLFDFKKPSGHLAYLKGKEIRLPDIQWEKGIFQLGLRMPEMGSAAEMD